MKNIYDIIVIGLGVMGTAALWRAASKSARVLGIEASGPTHSYGSSQGESRIFRRAYWEGEKFLPLLNHADLLWNELEQLTQRQLIFRTGGLFIGHASSRIFAGSIQTAKEGKIEHEIWSDRKIKETFPAFDLKNDLQAVFESGAYAISACEARLGMLNEAIRLGAIAQFGDRIVHLENHKLGVRAITQSGQTYIAKAAIITNGPWITTSFISGLRDHLEPRQVPIYWFNPKKHCKSLFSTDKFPVFLYELKNGDILYGAPSINSNEPGVKIGFHNKQQTPSIPNWNSNPVEQLYLDEISRTVESIFPGLDQTPMKAKNCFYTTSPDESFLIGNHESFKSTFFASACSGHGFKFAPAIGDALANMAIGQQPDVSISAFSRDRFG